MRKGNPRINVEISEELDKELYGLLPHGLRKLVFGYLAHKLVMDYKENPESFTSTVEKSLEYAKELDRCN